MSRWTWFWVCAVLGLLTLVGGWLVPIHLRAIDVRVIERAGRGTSGLRERAQMLVGESKIEPAQMLLSAAQQQKLIGFEQIGAAITNVARQGLSAKDALPAKALGGASPAEAATLPLMEVFLRLENREHALASLRASRSPAAQALLHCQTLTNNVLFPSSGSASGQPFDAALAICGLLLDQGCLSAPLSNTVFSLASQASADPQPLEQVLMDLLSLSERLDWSQAVSFVGLIQDPTTLRALTDTARQAGDRLPLLFAAVELSGRPGAVAHYLTDYSQTGLKDVGTALRFGSGGLNELLLRDQRLYVSSVAAQIAQRVPLNWFFGMALEEAWRAPQQALALKWILYLAGGFLLAMALHFARPSVPPLERPLQVRGFHFAREVLFALGFLLVVLLLSEPFLAQESQKAEFVFRLRLPTVGSAAPAGAAIAKSSFMNQQPTQILTLLLFFVLQSLIYIACLVKLAEIRRQRVPARVKLKLLENEDHLFDAGLYLGFAGTIISLILVSLQVFQFSLMAAYSSTSFGIIFVSVFKIFHLRPARRTLLLEVESVSAEPASSPSRPALATSP